MAARSELATAANEFTLEITRILDAPRELVFKAWTQPEHLVHWWGPRGFTLPSCRIDLRSGGAYRFHMRGPGGSDHYSNGVFREVIVPEKIVMAGGWTDAEGNPTRPPGIITIILDDLGGEKTRLTLRHEMLESATARDEHHSGWSQSFDRLGEYLGSA